MRRKARVIYTVVADYEYDNQEYKEATGYELEVTINGNRSIGDHNIIRIMDEVSTKITKSVEIIDLKGEPIEKKEDENKKVSVFDVYKDNN